MASEPAEPATRPRDDVIERARQLIDDEVLTRTGRSVGDLASGHVARPLADAGLLVGYEQHSALVPDLWWSPTKGLFRVADGLVGEWGHPLANAPLPADAMRLRAQP